MKCPKCTTDSAVYSIRDMKNGKYKIRSQTCKNKDCLLQFDSIEYAIPLGADIYIHGTPVQFDGTPVQFDNNL